MILYMKIYRCSPISISDVRTKELSGYPLKLYFQIPCVFPVQSQIFPVPIYIICDYYIDETDLADLSNFWGKNGNFHGKYRSILYLENQGIYNLSKQNSLGFPWVLAKFPNSLCFPSQGIFIGHFPCFSCFPCAVGTLNFVI